MGQDAHKTQEDSLTLHRESLAARFWFLVRQKIDEPQAEQLEFVPCGQIAGAKGTCTLLR